MLSRLLLFGLVVTWMLTGTAYAQDDTSTRKSSFFGSSGSKSSFFKLPTWSKSPKDSNKPSMYQRMSGTTKRWWDNTTDFLNPFNDAPPPKKPESTNWWRVEENPPEKSKGWFSGLWQPEEKPKKLETVNDFLKQPMPSY